VSCGVSVVLVDEAAEAVMAVDLADGWCRRWLRGLRGPEVERAMRSLRVVVLDVDAQHALEVAAVEDQQPVEAFGADGSDETLGDGVAFGARTGVVPAESPRRRWG
jgi:hypothetical protein